MKKLTKNELEKEFSKIILTKENHTHLDTTDLQLLINSSANKIFFYSSFEINMDINISIEEIKELNNYKMYLVQFRVNSQCSMLNFSKIIGIINETIDENAEIVFATKKDVNYKADFIEVKVFATC